MDFALNTKAAREADRLNARITEAGAYTGTLTRVEAVTSKNTGTKGVDIDFKADNGLTARLALWIESASGEPYGGYKAMMALMTCLQLREAKVATVEVEKWNAEAKQREKVRVQGYPDMIGARIGFLLKKEIEDKQDGSGSFDRMLIVGVYRAADGFMASEILDKAQSPKAFDEHLSVLMANPVNDKRGKKDDKGGAKQSAPAQGGFGDFSDDVPW